MKKLFCLTVIGLTLALQTGCNPFGGKPPPPSYKKWSKPGVPDLEVRKAMLECGYSDLDTNADLSYNETALVHRCMKKSGFKNSGWDACDKKNDYPACLLPESQVPDRSAERRLNSKHCQEVRKLYPDSKFCTQP